MSIHRRNAKRDKNEPAIIDALRAVGATVSEVSGAGVPDLVVGFREQNFLLEVKSKKGKLTPVQQKWHNEWLGSVHIVRTVDDALKAIGAIDR